MGATNAVFGLARQSFLTDVVPHHLRARALSTLGGMFLVGMVVGPFVAAPAISVGGPTAAFAVHLVACLVTVVVLLLLPRRQGHGHPGACHGGGALDGRPRPGPPAAPVVRRGGIPCRGGRAVSVVPLPAAIAVMGGCAVGTAGLLRRRIPAGRR